MVEHFSIDHLRKLAKEPGVFFDGNVQMPPTLAEMSEEVGTWPPGTCKDMFGFREEEIITKISVRRLYGAPLIIGFWNNGKTPRNMVIGFPYGDPICTVTGSDIPHSKNVEVGFQIIDPVEGYEDLLSYASDWVSLTTIDPRSNTPPPTSNL